MKSYAHIPEVPRPVAKRPVVQVQFLPLKTPQIPLKRICLKIAES